MTQSGKLGALRLLRTMSLAQHDQVLAIFVPTPRKLPRANWPT